MLAEPNSCSGMPHATQTLTIFYFLDVPGVIFKGILVKNANFHKGNGLETPSSEFSGLRMRDGVLSPAPLSCARPDRAQRKLRGPDLPRGGVPLEASVPVLGGVVPGTKTARFGPTFWRPALPEGETQQTGKVIRERGPISPTQAESADEEGNRQGSQSRTRARGGLGPGAAPDLL